MTTRPAVDPDLPRHPCRRLRRAVAFWSAVTGWRPVRRAAARTASSSRCCRRLDRRTSRCRPSTGPPASTSTSTRPIARRRSSARDPWGPPAAWTYHDVEVMRSPGGFVFCQTLVEGIADAGARRLDDPRPGLPRHPARRVGAGGRLLARPHGARGADRFTARLRPAGRGRSPADPAPAPRDGLRPGAGTPRPGDRLPRRGRTPSCGSGCVAGARARLLVGADRTRRSGLLPHRP